MAAISTIWFGIGGIIDLFRIFRDIAARKDNPLDDGWVDGHVSLANKAEFEHLDSGDTAVYRRLERFHHADADHARR